MAATIKHPHGHEFPKPPPNPPPPPGAVTLHDRLGARSGIARLIKWFYARVRFEPDLQPIFDTHIHRWSEHLDVLIDYWCAQTGGPRSDRAGMGRHFKLNLAPSHFATWLRVWRENCRDLLEPREAEEMIGLAERLADDLQRMIARRS